MGLAKRGRNREVHNFFVSYTVSDHMYYQLYTWNMGLRESKEAADSLHRAGYQYPRCSVEAGSIRGTEGKNIALIFNLSLNCTFCICIFII